MSQAGWYQDPAAPFMVRWWDGYRWTEAVQPGPVSGAPGPGWPGGGYDAGNGLAEESKAGRLASKALLAAAALVAGQGLIGALLLGRVWRSLRTQLDAPLRSDGTRAFVVPHGVTGLYVLSQLDSVVLLALEILFLIWFYRASSVAARAGLPARHSPAWAVAGWMIPVVNLWFPYQAAVDLFPPGHPSRKLAGRWWALYLAMSLSVVVVMAVSLVSEMLGVVLAVVVVGGLAFAAAVTARTLISEVDRFHAGLLEGRTG